MPRPVGYKLSEETKRKMREAANNWYRNNKRAHTEETKKRISESHKGKGLGKDNPMYGKSSWNKGKKMSEESRKKLSESCKGRTPWNKGKKCPSLSGENNSFYGRRHTKETKERLRQIHIGMRASEETKIKMSKIREGKYIGEKSSRWKGGISKLPYAFDFDKKLKKEIKKRDRYRCQNCRKKKRLCIHHIDYDKMNSNPTNLITLCISCNFKANNKRKYWEEYYTMKISRKYSIH